MSQMDYGIIGNCQISALLEKSGKIVWCCMPKFDAPSVFASLLDSRQGGFWSIEPAVDGVLGPWETKQHYMRNTNVLVTTHTGPQDEQFETIDFAPRFQMSSDEFYRPPQIVRVLRPLRGIPRVVVRCRPRPGYGKENPRIVNLGSAIEYRSENQEVFFLSTDASITYVLNEIPFELKESRDFVFSYGAPFAGRIQFEAQEQLDRTLAYWRGWAKNCNIPFEFQNEVLRSALALKLHIFEDTGAIIAASTTSIPEGPEHGRTWDYRYCWLRDAYFVVTALNQLGHFEEMESFIRYLQNLASSEPSGVLQPVYGIGGEKELLEQELPWLSGFRGFGPVRVGNSAWKMEQHDVYGEMVLAITPAFFDRRLDRTDQEQALKNVRNLIQQAIITFEKPDAGIWEFRGTMKHSVFSKLMNWAAVDRGVRIAGHVGRHDWVAEWGPIRERMRIEIETRAWSEKEQIYAQTYESESPDAANLLFPAVNFMSFSNERFQKMLEVYHEKLRYGRGVYRYRTPDDFGVPKTTFTVCAFWMADALWGAGRKAEARELFSAVTHKVNHLGLLSEDMDPETGELWGNFPQTYSHVGLINTAWKISQSWDDAF
ncbi:glycoside hydrolase family 15 protein [Bdellovibrionota bacterium FG-1]